MPHNLHAGAGPGLYSAPRCPVGRESAWQGLGALHRHRNVSVQRRRVIRMVFFGGGELRVWLHTRRQQAVDAVAGANVEALRFSPEGVTESVVERYTLGRSLRLGQLERGRTYRSHHWRWAVRQPGSACRPVGDHPRAGVW